METISVFGLWRDSSEYIQRTLDSFNNLIEDSRYDYEFFFFENDSKDNTRDILIDWMKNKKGKLIYENINAPKFGSIPDINRLVLMSYYRNKLNQLNKLTNSALSILLDTDIIFDNSHIYNLFRSQSRLDAAMVVANTRQYQIPDLMYSRSHDSFYDVSALRDKFGNECFYFADCPFVLMEDVENWYDNKPIKIMSGFSGLSVIKTEYLKLCKWSTNRNIEHVNFCYELNQYGEIYIIPECRPKTHIDINSINLDACKNIAIKQIEWQNNINDTFNVSISEKIIIN